MIDNLELSAQMMRVLRERIEELASNPVMLATSRRMWLEGKTEDDIRRNLVFTAIGTLMGLQRENENAKTENSVL